MSDISFCDTDVQEIETRIIEGYEKLVNKKLYPADPIRIFLQGLAYIIGQQRIVINETGKQNLLRYATGYKLDAIGEMMGTTRIPESFALVTVTFIREDQSKGAIPIKSGTRVTADSIVYFQTVDGIMLPDGENSIDVQCQAMTSGIVGNNYAPGAINKIVDPISYIKSVSNQKAPSGGADEENDDNFRKRINIAPEHFSVAGPILAYEYFAKSAHAEIEDVAVISPNPGVVKIYPLMNGGKLPDNNIIKKVSAILNNEKIRPLTDKVEVIPPDFIPKDKAIDVDIKCYCYENNVIMEDIIKTAVDKYIIWQISKLGRDINPDMLRNFLMNTGIKRVDINSPTYIVLEKNQVANIGEIKIEFGDNEDE